MSENNYITTMGLERIQRELQWLQSEERPKIVSEVSRAAAMGDRSENAEYIYGKKRLRQIDGRMGYLVGRLNKLVVVEPCTQVSQHVVFGATVVVMDEADEQKAWRVYGEDEVAVEKGIISWKSPLGQALLGRGVGDAVQFQAPGGQRELEVVEIRYEEQDPHIEEVWRNES